MNEFCIFVCPSAVHIYIYISGYDSIPNTFWQLLEKGMSSDPATSEAGARRPAIKCKL
jgi:hypothetical protein